MDDGVVFNPEKGIMWKGEWGLFKVLDRDELEI